MVARTVKVATYIEVSYRMEVPPNHPFIDESFHKMKHPATQGYLMTVDTLNMAHVSIIFQGLDMQDILKRPR